MAVMIGSARSDERGKASGGKAGDQKNGLEVSKQKWYKHSKGWRVLRCKIPEMRGHMSDAMDMACNNNYVGYDQHQRDTLRKAVASLGYNISKLKKAVETDCSALVRVCVLYALYMTGRSNDIPDFITSNEVTVLLATGLFTELKGSKYTDQEDYLLKGDILVTKSKGHTVIVVVSGGKAGEVVVPKTYQLGDRVLKNGHEGSDVKELQLLLIELGYNLGRYGADGDFGDCTEDAVENFQRKYYCEVDGVVGNETLTMLNKVFNAQGDDGENRPNAKHVMIVGGKCYVRSAPNTSGKKLGVVQEYNQLEYQGQMSEDGWYLVTYKNQNGWVSGKYSKLIG